MISLLSRLHNGFYHRGGHIVINSLNGSHFYLTIVLHSFFHIGLSTSCSQITYTNADAIYFLMFSLCFHY